MKTAVEWLVEQMKLDELFNADYFIDQAKEMFEQQIIDAYECGSENGYELAKNDDFVEGFKVKKADEYYNEIYKSE